ncbi:MAG: hypothetical protein O2910_05665 [Proteobacteria bacterium]|nr:hypothetical protein [Pseudomonadota bacterium]
MWLGAILVGSALLIAPATADDKRAIEIRIENRAVVVPESGTIKIHEDDVVDVQWSSDEAAELHIHGYDLHINVRPGKTTNSTIKAHATGRFPITSHGWGDGGHGHDALAYLEVHPR